MGSDRLSTLPKGQGEFASVIVEKRQTKSIRDVEPDGRNPCRILDLALSRRELGVMLGRSWVPQRRQLCPLVSHFHRLPSFALPPA